MENPHPLKTDYFVSIVIIVHLIPLVLILILYITIYFKLKSRKFPGERSANAGQQRQQRERNVLKMAIAIVLGFVVCWLPYIIYWFLYIFASDLWSCGLIYFLSVASVMFCTNCAVNPCICLIFSRNYRIGLKTLFS